MAPYSCLYFTCYESNWTQYICDGDLWVYLEKLHDFLFPASVAICIAVKPAVPMIMHSWEIHLEDSGEIRKDWSLITSMSRTKIHQKSNIYWFCSYHVISWDCFHTICTSETVSAITKQHSAAPLKWKQVALAQAIPPALDTTRCNHHHNAGQSCCLSRSEWTYWSKWERIK